MVVLQFLKWRVLFGVLDVVSVLYRIERAVEPVNKAVSWPGNDRFGAKLVDKRT